MKAGNFVVVFCLILVGHGKEGLYSVVRNGDFMIQGLFPLTYRDGDKCERIYADGLTWSLALEFAVKTVNKAFFLHNSTLGYKIDNTCFNIPTAMSNAIEIVAKHRPNSVCYPHDKYCKGKKGEIKTKPISAVIGPAISWISIPIASLLGLYSIPQISYASTSRILSDKTRYRSFLRTVPSDEYQAWAMAEFVQYFEWNYVFLIASDDDYGKMGASAFKSAARRLNVCIANDEYIAFTSDRVKDYVRDTLGKLKSVERAKVIIVFSYLWQGEILLTEAERMNITDRTWITSDGWNTGAKLINVSKTMLEGIFTFAILSKPVPDFQKYVRNLSIRDAEENPWLLRYMEDILKCRRPGNYTVPSKMPGSYRTCGTHEKLPPETEVISELVPNVIDAVKATANALRAIIECQNGKVNCPKINEPISPDVFLSYVANTSFVGTDDVVVKFDGNGDLTSSGYIVRNLQVLANKKLEYVDVGNWSLVNETPKFNLNKSLIKWNRGARPLSTCFRVCLPGEKIVGQSECCWNCQRCEKGTVSSEAGSYACVVCNETHYDNAARTKCIVREIVYMSFSSAAGVLIFTFALLGILITSCAAVVFWRLRQTPIISTSGRWMLSAFFVTLQLTFLFGIIFVFAKPTTASCIIIESIHELLTMLYSGFLFAKTRAANNILRRAVSPLKDMPSDLTGLIILGVSIAIELVLIVIRQSMAPSRSYFWNQEDNSRLLECQQHFNVARIMAVAVPMTILVTTTFLAFRERNNTDAFNEPKFLSFSTIALCILLIAFIPTYRYVVGISRILVVVFTAFATAFSCMGCLFIPKLYVIFVRPEQNTETDRRHQENEADGSDAPSPHLRLPFREKTKQRKADFSDIEKDNNVNHCDNKGLDDTDHVTEDHVNGRKRSTGRKVSNIRMNFELSTVIESTEEEPNGLGKKSGAFDKRAASEPRLSSPDTEEEACSNAGYLGDDTESGDWVRNHLSFGADHTPRAFTVI